MKQSSQDLRPPTQREWNIIDATRRIIENARDEEWEETITESALALKGIQDDSCDYAVTIKREMRTVGQREKRDRDEYYSVRSR